MPPTELTGRDPVSPVTRDALDALERRPRRARLERRIDEALRRSRSSGRAVPLSMTVRLSSAIDPLSTVVASRRAGEAWFHLGQTDRDTALAALGCAHELTASGPARFTSVAREWRELVASAVADDPEGPPGSGLAAMGGFAFSATGGASPPWRGYRPASMVVPDLSLARAFGETWLTLNLMVNADDTPMDLVAGVKRRLADLQTQPLPLLDPAPTGRFTVSSPMPPSHYEEAVARAVERIRRGELKKVVLAREVEVRAPAHHDPAAVLGVLRDGFPSCFVYAVGRGDTTFLGASPELLVRREGQRATTVALAGSTGRSADPAVDDHLGERLLRSDKDREENAIVARRIAKALAPHAIWVTVAPEPSVVRVANIQHLAAPIRAQLTAPLSAVELASILHPTPAVGGEPWAQAEPLIPALEGFDRGWYAGPVGWCDQMADGEFCVALRCARINADTATCFAGCGIVADSDPAAELAETEVKLQALLPVLAG